MLTRLAASCISSSRPHSAIQTACQKARLPSRLVILVVSTAAAAACACSFATSRAPAADRGRPCCSLRTSLEEYPRSRSHLPLACWTGASHTALCDGALLRPFGTVVDGVVVTPL